MTKAINTDIYSRCFSCAKTPLQIPVIAGVMCLRSGEHQPSIEYLLVTMDIVDAMKSAIGWQMLYSSDSNPRTM